MIPATRARARLKDADLAPLPWSEKQSKAGTWISTCEPLRLVAWGDTKEDLEICKRKVTTLLLSYLAQHGILESLKDADLAPNRGMV